jgi:hypothetical protein
MATLPTRLQAQASAITTSTLIHIVVTGDTSQSPDGSSYKATLGQLTSLFSGGTGNNIYNSDGVLSSGRVVDMNGNFLYFSGGSSNILFGFIGSGEKHLQWIDAALNWDLYNENITNNLKLDRYSSLGGYLDTPLFVEFSTGNVGVGNQTPTEKLDVSGKTKTINFQMTSGATNGYVLTSDASGNASWQSGATGNNIYNSDGTLTANRTITQGSFDVEFTGDEFSRLQTSYSSTINPLDNGSFANGVSGTNIGHQDVTNDLYFDASLVPGNASMDVSVISTGELGGINFNSSSSSLIHYDGVSTNRTISVDISGTSINQQYYFPNSDGTNGQVLTTDGSGNTSWQPKVDYVEYRALLTQTGTSAPDESILVDTIGGGIWSYSDVGSYYFTKVGAFSASSKVEVYMNNTIVLSYTMSNPAFNIYSINRLDDDTIEVRTSTWSTDVEGSSLFVSPPGASAVSDAMSNDLLYNNLVSIRVWS